MTDTAAAAPARLPLFYREPQPLSDLIHADWRLVDGDMRFAADTPYVPIVASEFMPAAQSYPIVFALGGGAPVAVLGIDRANLFVENGRWDAEAHVPAYVRRYPFGFIAAAQPGRFMLAIDAAAERVARGGEGHGGEGGAALFEDGKPSALTRRALEFCDAYHADAGATEAFSAALAERELLIERRADATLPDGRSFGLHGFQIVDADRFAALDDATVVLWHRRGWLALVHFHLASLDRFRLLLARQGRRSGVADEPVLEERLN